MACRLLKLGALLFVLALLTACSGNATAPAASHGPQLSTPLATPGVAPVALPLPSTLPKVERRASGGGSIDDYRTGDDWADALPHQRAAPGLVKMQFTPAWDGSSDAAAGLAYCMYDFHPVGFSSKAQVRYHFLTAPSDPAKVWIGIANWGKDRWDWYPSTANRRLDLATFLPYFNPLSSNRCVVTVLCLGANALDLAAVRLGTSPPLAEIEASQTVGASPLAVTFDPASSSDPDSLDDPSAAIVKYEWDLEPDGVFEITTTTPAVQNHAYSASGPGTNYAPVLRVTDNDGAQSSQSITINVVTSWQHSLGGANEDRYLAFAQDAGGYIYATGYTQSFGSANTSLLLSRFGPDGTLYWSKYWGGTDSVKGEAGSAVAVDGAGNVYVAGNTLNFGAGARDALIQKWNGNGALLWTKTWGEASGEDVTGICTDGDSLIVVGNTTSWGAGGDVFYVKFDSAGAVVWANTWGGPLADYVDDIKQLEYTGGPPPPPTFACAGGTYSFGAGSCDAFTLSFSESGALLDQRSFGNAANQSAAALTSDSGGNIYVTGLTWLPSGNTGVLLYKLNLAGNLVYNSTWELWEGNYGNAVALPGDGNVMVAGYSADASASNRGLFIAFDQASGAVSGAESWSTGATSGAIFQAMLHCPYGGFAFCGLSDTAGGSWYSALGSAGTLSGASISPLSQAATAVVGVVTSPAGPVGDAMSATLDTGGGSADALVLYRRM